MHGKYWYLEDEYDDQGIPYKKIIKRLQELNYKGYIACQIKAIILIVISILNNNFRNMRCGTDLVKVKGRLKYIVGVDIEEQQLK